MITNKKELKDVLEMERKLYIQNCPRGRELRLWFTKEPVYMIWSYVKSLRKCEYLKNSGGGFTPSGLRSAGVRKTNWVIDWDLRFMRIVLRKGCRFSTAIL